jgi:hypothetical protein
MGRQLFCCARRQVSEKEQHTFVGGSPLQVKSNAQEQSLPLGYFKRVGERVSFKLTDEHGVIHVEMAIGLWKQRVENLSASSFALQMGWGRVVFTFEKGAYYDQLGHPWKPCDPWTVPPSYSSKLFKRDDVGEDCEVLHKLHLPGYNIPSMRFLANEREQLSAQLLMTFPSASFRLPNVRC